LRLEALEDRTLLSISSTGDLIAAINMANSSGTPTTITLTPNINFAFQFADNFNVGLNALPVITGNITIVGSGGDFLTRTSTTAERFFDVAPSGTLTLQNLTLEGGVAQGTGQAAQGGAIFTGGTLNLSNVTVQNNVAQGTSGTNAGGANGAGGNGAAAFGGGLYVDEGNVSLTNVVLSSNSAIGGSGGNGLINTNPTGNNFIPGPGGAGGNGGAANGGGIYVAQGNVSLSNDTLSGNSAVMAPLAAAAARAARA
jgi:hypothetical protein